MALIAETPQVLVINPQLPFKSVAELVAYVKENPGKLNYSTGGIGTLPHLNAELFKSVSGANILHVPYKGGGPSLTAVVAGEVQMTFDTVSTSLQLIQDGKLRGACNRGSEAHSGVAGCACDARDRVSGADQRGVDGADGPLCLIVLLALMAPSAAQIPPSAAEIAACTPRRPEAMPAKSNAWCVPAR